MLAMSSTAALKAPSLARDGLLKPLIFLTNCSDAARISSSVTGGAKLKSVLMFLHIPPCLQYECPACSVIETTEQAAAEANRCRRLFRRQALYLDDRTDFDRTQACRGDPRGDADRL